MIDITEIVAVVMSMSIPLSIIGGVIYLKAKKMRLQQFSTEERQVLLQLKRENTALRERLDSIETIIAEVDDTLLLKGPKQTPEDAAKRIEELRQKIGH